MRTRIETITPHDAKAILSRNSGNRNVRNSIISQYAEMMKNGEWDLTPHGIVIDTSGNLLDGQHRLHGVIMADIAVNFTVTRDANPEIFRSLDRGAHRSDHDLIGGKRMVVEACSGLARFIYPNDKNIRNVERIHNSEIGQLLIELDEYCGTSRAPYSNVIMRVGAVINILKNPSNKQYIFDLYRTLVLNKFEDMTPIGFATVRRIGSVMKRFRIDAENLAISLYVFDRNNEQSSKIRIMSSVLDHVSDDVRNTVFSILEGIKEFSNSDDMRFISYESKNKMWNVKIPHHGRRINFGYFEHVQHAIHARNEFMSQLRNFDRQPTPAERKKIKEAVRNAK